MSAVSQVDWATAKCSSNLFGLVAMQFPMYSISKWGYSVEYHEEVQLRGPRVSEKHLYLIKL
jgi:hypothetical protein